MLKAIKIVTSVMYLCITKLAMAVLFLGIIFTKLKNWNKKTIIIPLKRNREQLQPLNAQ